MDPKGNHSVDAEEENVSETTVEEPCVEDPEVESPYVVAELAKHGIIRLDEAGQPEEYESVKRKFLQGMGPMADKTRLIAVHKNAVFPSANMRARKHSFDAALRAVANKRGGLAQANLAEAFFGASRDDIADIIKNGFTAPNILTAIAANSPYYGVGCLHLSPPKNLLDRQKN